MKRLLFGFSVVAVLWIAACNGGNGTVNPPPPVGKYGLSSLKGQYAFTTNGESFAAGATTATPLARVGSFTADGAGNITTGMEDVNAAGRTSLAIQITGGSYTVNADGRGTLALSLNGGATINFGITLTSTSDGLMIDETSTNAQSSTGSGNFTKQTGPFPLASINGPYVFDFTGLDGTGGPESIVGEFTASGGPINTGFQDVNDNGIFSNAAATGSVFVDGGNPSTLPNFGRGNALIAGINYVFYIVDGTRVRFLSTSGSTMLSGDAVAQSNTIPTNVASINSSFVFIVAGSSGSGGVVRVGRFTANGGTVTAVLQDTNDGGRFIKTDPQNISAASISFDPANAGRGTFTFTDQNFPNAPSTFIFYLSSATQGVIQEQTANKSGAVDVADGTLAAQTGSPFASSNISGTYALSWSGLSLQNGGGFSVQDEEDFVGQVTVSSLSLTGAGDIFQFQSGAPVFDLVASGSISISGDGTSSSSSNRNTMSVKIIKSDSTTVNCVVYFVNPNLAFFMNNQDANRTVAGALQTQQ